MKKLGNRITVDCNVLSAFEVLPTLTIIYNKGDSIIPSELGIHVKWFFYHTWVIIVIKNAKS